MTVAQHDDLPVGYYRTTPRKPYLLTNDVFRVYVEQGGRRIRMDDLVESFSWDDVDANLRGAMTVHETPFLKRGFKFSQGDTVSVDVALGGTGFTPLWDMVIDSLDQELSGGSKTLSLTDPVLNLDRSEDSWKYVRGKGHPKGWKTDDVIRDVAKRYGFPVHITPMEAFVTQYVKQKISPMQVIQDMLARERTAKNRRMVMRFRRGALYLTPLVRSAVLLEMGPTLLDGSLQLTRDPAFATQLTMRATAKSGSKKTSKKISTVIESKPATQRFGRIHREEFDPHADSIAELKANGKKLLAKRLLPVREFSFGHQGIPALRRGQSCKLVLKNYGLTQIVWVKEVSHSVSAGSYTMNVTVVFDDPFKADEEAWAKEQRAKKAKKHGRTPEADPPKADPPKAPGSTQKEDPPWVGLWPSGGNT